MLRLPSRCKHCNEFFFSVKVLRHDTSNELVEQEIQNIKYCPFCGERIDRNEQKGK